MVVGYWMVSENAVRTSYDDQRPMELGEPDQVFGPGCAACEQHWLEGKDQPCPGSVSGGRHEADV